MIVYNIRVCLTNSIISNTFLKKFYPDFGSNIGMFTLAVAAMGRKVKSVDAGYINHAYMRYSMYISYINFN